MKSKLCLLAVVVVLAALLARTHWRASRLQQALDFQTASIKSMAATDAREDLSRGSVSYFLFGQLERDYTEAFALHFKDYGVRPVARGCKVFEAQAHYSDEYNRVVRDGLVKRHGKDLIQEFQNSYLAERSTR